MGRCLDNVLLLISAFFFIKLPQIENALKVLKNCLIQKQNKTKKHDKAQQNKLRLLESFFSSFSDVPWDI